MFDAGLADSRPRCRAVQGSVLGAICRRCFFRRGFAVRLGIVLLIILDPLAHLVWFFRTAQSQPACWLIETYFPGIFETCWWAASTLATQADQMPRAALARVLAVIWMFTSVVFIAYFTAAVTSSLTVQQLRGEINGPEDLPGKRVASVHGSTSADYLRQRSVELMEFAKVEEAFRRSNKARSTPWSTTRPCCSTTRRTRVKAKCKPSARSFAKKITASPFPRIARIENRSTKRY